MGSYGSEEPVAFADDKLSWRVFIGALLLLFLLIGGLFGLREKKHPATAKTPLANAAAPVVSRPGRPDLPYSDPFWGHEKQVTDATQKQLAYERWLARGKKETQGTTPLVP